MQKLLPGLSQMLAKVRQPETEALETTSTIAELTEQLRNTPSSAFAHALAILPKGQSSPTDQDIALWRDERYGL